MAGGVASSHRRACAPFSHVARTRQRRAQAPLLLHAQEELNIRESVLDAGVAQVSSLRTRCALAVRSVCSRRAVARLSYDNSATNARHTHTPRTHRTDGRRAFLTTLAYVSFANDEIMSTRGTIDCHTVKMLLLLILLIFFCCVGRYSRLFGSECIVRHCPYLLFDTLIDEDIIFEYV